jgi:hypothetical protein
MNVNSLGVVLSPGGLAAKAGADSRASSRPDPEVVAKAKRRRGSRAILFVPGMAAQ